MGELLLFFLFGHGAWTRAQSRHAVGSIEYVAHGYTRIRTWVEGENAQDANHYAMWFTIPWRNQINYINVRFVPSAGNRLRRHAVGSIE